MKCCQWHILEQPFRILVYPLLNYVTTQLKRFIARTAHFLVLRLVDSRVWVLFSRREILSFQLAHNRAFMIFFLPQN